MAFLLLRKRMSGVLEPADDASREALTRIAVGDVVRAEVKRTRNLHHHRKYWALVSLIYQNQTRFKTPEELNDALKVHVGHCETMTLRDGQQVRIPKSIAFHAMDQGQFEDFYNRVLDVVVAEIIPGLNKDDLKRELLEFAA